MLINIFKTGHIIIQILLLLIISAVTFSYAFVNPTITDVDALSFLDTVLMSKVHIPIFTEMALSLILIIITAILLHVMLVKAGLEKRQSYLCILIFIVLVGELSHPLAFTPTLILQPIIIAIFWLIFSLSNSKQPGNTILSLSILSAFGAILYTPMLMAIIIVWIGIVSFSTMNIKLILVSILGFITPFLLLHSILFAMGNTSIIASFVESVSKEIFNNITYSLPVLLNAITYCLLMFSLPKIYATRTDNTVDTRRKFNLVMSTIVSTILLTLLFFSSAGNTFMLAIIPLSIMFGFLFQYSKHTIVQEIGLLLIMTLSLLNNYSVI